MRFRGGVCRCSITSELILVWKNDLRVLKFIYKAPNHEASASEIAAYLDYDDEKAGRFPWIMRQELVLAFEEVYGLEEEREQTTFLDADLFQDLQPHSEGEKISIVINRYERNRKARTACLKHYGYPCVICGFNFAKILLSSMALTKESMAFLPKSLYPNDIYYRLDTNSIY